MSKSSSFLPLLILTTALSWPAAAEAAEYVEGEVIVTFKATATEAAMTSALKEKSMVVARKFQRLSDRRRKPTRLVRKQTGQTTADMINQLKADPAVESAEPNYLRRVSAAPDDTRFPELWALRNTGQSANGTSGTSGVDIDYLAAQDMARANPPELVVGVLDTGVDHVHPDLAANVWVNAAEIPGNSLDDDSNGYVDDRQGYDFASDDADPSDSGYHGTHVAGTIAAIGNNQSGIIGVNRNVRIVPMKVSSDGTTISTSAVIEALEYAIALKNSGVNIVALNASYGGSGNSTAERAAIQAAGDAGILFCAAAGNESSNNDADPVYPAGYRLPNMIVVAATTQTDTLASFSNYGATTVDIAAPGDNILSLKPSTISFTAGSTTYASNELTFSGVTTGVTGMIYDCGIGNPEDFPAAVDGNIALIQRGTLTFATKVTNAMNAGARAAIIYNNVSGNFSGTLQTAGNWIPARSISMADGLAIKAALPRTGAVVVTGEYQFLDGTSMACPHVTGAVVFAAQNHPPENVAQRRARVLAAVETVGSLAGKVVTGGRLNLARVVDADNDNVADWYEEVLAHTPVMANASMLPGAVKGTAYEVQLSSTGGTAPYTYVVSSGTLPAGLTLDSGGLLSGSPGGAGTFSFTVTVTEDDDWTGSKSFTLVVAETYPVITTAAALPSGFATSPYSLQLSATDGTAPFAWTVEAGELPDGFTLTSEGLLSGTTEEVGGFSFTLKLTDAGGLTASRTFTLSLAQPSVVFSTDAVLDTAVLHVPYFNLLQAQGGGTPHVWSLDSGALPPGVQLSSSGLLSGTPTTAGNFTFAIAVQETGGFVARRSFSLRVSGSFLLPIMNAATLPAATLGVSYSTSLSAKNYPSSYIITGLPKGLAYDSSTGVISGRPLASGVFSLVARAKNSAGTGDAALYPLVVDERDADLTGSFTGVIGRDATANAGLGGRLNLSITKTGYYTAKVRTGAVTRSAVGYLNGSTPHLNIAMNGALLTLNIDTQTGDITGTHGSAVVTGWRSVWSTTAKPATTRIGYYGAALDLADAQDDGVITIPQGSGYLRLTLTASGTATITGRTADNQAVSSTSFISADGHAALYTPLYSNKGSVVGAVQVMEDLASISNNMITGRLSWMRPRVTTPTARTYRDGFGPVDLAAQGMYLAPKSTGTTILGLPSTGSLALSFTDGGLHLAALDPDVPSLIYAAPNLVTMPAAGSTDNPAKATLSVNKSTGAVTGTFTLVEPSPALTRKVTWQGQIVRATSGTRRAAGFFLLPQIPLTGQPAGTSPILSGGVRLDQ